MSYRAIYAYPWDLADEGVVAVIREPSAALGIDTVTIAGSYHAGQIPASAWAERTSVLSGGWHRLFQS